LTKEFVSIGIFLIMTAVSFYGLALLWRRLGSAARAAAIVGIAAAYAALTYLLSLWAAQGGWPEGMFFMMTALFVAVPAVVVFAVLLVLALFGGPGRGRRVGMAVSFIVLGVILVAFAFNGYLRLAWYARDLDNPDPDRRGYAVLMIGQTGLSAAGPMIISAAHDPVPAVRRNAVLALATLDDPDTVAAVREALSDEDAGVREAAVIAVVPLGRGGPEVVSDLKRMLGDPDPGVREAAAGGLDTLDPTIRTAPAVPKR
jgi:hypothetical protein